MNHLQKPANPDAVWEIAVPNGTYTVRIVAGDASNFDSVFRISAEGVLAVSGTPTTTTRWVEGTSTVTVADGRLTMASARGEQQQDLFRGDYAAIVAIGRYAAFDGSAPPVIVAPGSSDPGGYAGVSRTPAPHRSISVLLQQRHHRFGAVVAAPRLDDDREVAWRDRCEGQIEAVPVPGTGR